MATLIGRVASVQSDAPLRDELSTVCHRYVLIIVILFDKK